MNIYALNSTIFGLDNIDYIAARLPVAGVIGTRMAGQTDQETYCDEKGIPFVRVEDCSLMEKEDKKSIRKCHINILIVAGWTRLVPEWLIDKCEVVVGIHGSAYGIEAGRGRSPQNWALLMGKKHFHISIFKIDTGADSGDVINTCEYKLSKHDDIKTSYHKSGWLASQMIVDSIMSGGIFEGYKQTIPATYLPKRTPDDGWIDWKRTSRQVYDFVRALTRPYHGARTYNSMWNEVRIYRARPFCINTGENHTYGKVVRVFNDGAFVVTTSDSYLLVDDYTGSVVEGTRLKSAVHENQMQNIINRHREAYPDKPINKDLL
jgi:methionyl-tRNA formyltransferase